MKFDYNKLFNNARVKFLGYKGHATQDMRAEDSFDWWIASEAYALGYQVGEYADKRDVYRQGEIDGWNAAINAAQAKLAAEFVSPEIVIELIGGLKK